MANAGVTRDTLALRMTEDAWSEVIDTNLTAVFRVTKRALAKMIRLHRGRVIMISSVGAFIGSAGQANYAASKAGLVGMARSLAREVASRAITVNVVAPGLVETNMLAGLGEAKLAEFAAQVPLGRVASARRGGQCRRVPRLRRCRVHHRGRRARRRRVGHGSVTVCAAPRHRQHGAVGSRQDPATQRSHRSATDTHTEETQ